MRIAGRRLRRDFEADRGSRALPRYWEFRQNRSSNGIFDLLGEQIQRIVVHLAALACATHTFDNLFSAERLRDAAALHDRENCRLDRGESAATLGARTAPPDRLASSARANRPLGNQGAGRTGNASGGFLRCRRNGRNSDSLPTANPPTIYRADPRTQRDHPRWWDCQVDSLLAVNGLLSRSVRPPRLVRGRSAPPRGRHDQRLSH